MAFKEKYMRLIKAVALFKGLNPDELMKLMTMGLTTAVHKGTELFKKGTVGEEMYVILDGKVKIIDEDEVIATLGKGEMFGEMALFSSEPRSATAVTEESTSFFVLTAKSLHELFGRRVAIRLLLNIVGTLSTRLRTANERIRQLEHGGTGA